MLTAQEARVLSELSEKTIEGYVKLALSHVKGAAELGVREKAMYCLPWAAKVWLELVKPTKVQEKIMDKLKELGYSVSFERDENGYVPRGLEDDAPLHYNEVIVVSW
jgi:hypothetical protein